MSREIEFRGLNKDGDFVYGFYVQGAFDGTSRMLTHGIQRTGCYPEEIYPKSLGQFTGILDFNGLKIFTGDIVRDHNGIGEVQYSDKKAAFKVNYHDGFAKWFIDYNLRCERESIEVIGNIHKNSELLK